MKRSKHHMERGTGMSQKDRHNTKRKDGVDNLLAIANSPTPSDDLPYAGEIFLDNGEGFDVEAYRYSDNNDCRRQRRSRRGRRRQEEVEEDAIENSNSSIPKTAPKAATASQPTSEDSTSKVDDSEWWKQLSAKELEQLRQLYTSTPLARNVTYDTTLLDDGSNEDSFEDELEQINDKRTRTDRKLMCVSVTLSIVAMALAGLLFGIMFSPLRNNSENQVAGVVDGGFDAGIGGGVIQNTTGSNNNNNNNNNNNSDNNSNTNNYGETEVAIDEESNNDIRYDNDDTKDDATRQSKMPTPFPTPNFYDSNESGSNNVNVVTGPPSQKTVEQNPTVGPTLIPTKGLPQPSLSPQTTTAISNKNHIVDWYKGMDLFSSGPIIAAVGDTVTFNWSSGTHDVYKHPSNSCDETDRIEVSSAASGPSSTTYTFTASDADRQVVTFACDIGSHCENSDMIVSFKVTSIASTTTSLPRPQGGTSVNYSVDWKMYSDMKFTTETVRVGDTVTFTWETGQHDVHKHPTNNCDKENAIEVAPASIAPGTITYTFTEEDAKDQLITFTCDVDEHCSNGNMIKNFIVEQETQQETSTSSPALISADSEDPKCVDGSLEDAHDLNRPNVLIPPPEPTSCVVPQVAAPKSSLFNPLDCNIDLHLASCTTSWTSKFSSSSVHADEIVIPCGECIYMDHSGPTLSLSGGLDVQGKLIFQTGSYASGLVIDAPYIIVQGELEMDTPIPVTDNEDIKFVLTGTSESITQFVPAGNNANVCGSSGCDVGKKPVVVAGGKLNIRGLPVDTPTWVNLYDFKVSDDDSKASTAAVGTSRNHDVNWYRGMATPSTIAAAVGDTVTFSWSDGTHNVFMHPTNTCDETEAVEVIPTSLGPIKTTYTFTASDQGKTVTFACDVGAHCENGNMIVSFEVSGNGEQTNIKEEKRGKYLVVNDAVKDKWAVGADILITSHTANYDGGQVRQIRQLHDHTVPGYVLIELDSSIVRPTTMLDNPDFAVEVVLLSRNIVFEGAKDDLNDPLHGMHLMVLQTPNIQQKLEGIEVRNGGQQGNLGRYPIHFHMCHDVCGSLVSKNIVRQSNQRCYIVHGTHNLELDSNIAYDTAGHCFMTEDGIEEGNIFRRNLGALTKKVQKVIPPIANNGDETDNEPSTFWMTSPTNIFVGNVAAGSESSGFWFEFRIRLRGPSQDLAPKYDPTRKPLTLFRDNVAHSNNNNGLQNYPGSGYDPFVQPIFYNTRSYRNKNSGVFFRFSRNAAIVGGVYADNRIQLNFDSAAQVHLRDASVIGLSAEYRTVLDSQYSAINCNNIVGVDLHTFNRQAPAARTPRRDFGAVIENVNFAGFTDLGCHKGMAINFDDAVERVQFDYYSSLSNISIEEGVAPIDFCDAKNSGVNDIVVTDLDSSLKPTGVSFAGTSSIVSSTRRMTAFLDSTSCREVPDHCHTYCTDTCLRSVSYAINPAETENIELQLCRTGNDQPTCIGLLGKYDEEKRKIIENTLTTKLRYFHAALPPGNFEAVFRDRSTGEQVWPTFVDEVFERAHCPNALCDESVELIVPSLDSSECNDLIKNGDAEDDEEHPKHWLHRSGGVRVAPDEGREDSTALADIVQKNSRTDGIGQYLDSRCLKQEVGSTYEIKAWVKTKKTSDGSVYFCDSNKEGRDCPRIYMYLFTPDGDEFKSATKLAAKIAAASEDEESSKDDGFQLLRGKVTITKAMGDASRVLFFIRRSRKDVEMFVDDVSMKLIDGEAEDESAPEAAPYTAPYPAPYSGPYPAPYSAPYSSYRKLSQKRQDTKRMRKRKHTKRMRRTRTL